MPVIKLRPEGALLCEGFNNNDLASIVIDTGSGISSTHKAFVERSMLTKNKWQGPTALLPSGQKFKISESCVARTESAGFNSISEFDIVEIFSFDVLLGADILCRIHFLLNFPEKFSNNSDTLCCKRIPLFLMHKTF